MPGTGWYVDPFTLTVPPGAGPGDARIVIGSTVPPGLAAYYATGPFNGQPDTVVTAILFYGTGGVIYEWDALLLNPAYGLDTPLRGFGRFDPASLVPYKEVWRLVGQGYYFDAGTSGIVEGSMRINQVNGGRFNIQDKVLSGQGQTLSQVAGVGARNNVAFANLPGNPSVTITKLYPAADTDLKCVYNVSGFATVAGTRMDIAVTAGAGAAKGGQLVFSAPVINSHLWIPGLTRLTGLGVGAITVNLQWASTGNVQTDGNDWVELDVMEVPIQ
jgi:hypothetical protein